MTKFVNPYSFVPLPSRVARGLPAGHARLLPDRVSGSLHLDLECESPLLVRGVDGEGRLVFPVDAQGRPVLPAAGLRGAVRSLHETLAGGCLRVFDEEFVPVYRDQAVAHGRRLAMVVRGPDASLSVQLCSDVVHVELQVFQVSPGYEPDLLRSGQQVRLSGVEPFDDHGRMVLRARQRGPAGQLPQARLGDGDHRLFVSDTRARSRSCLFVVGRPEGKPLPVPAEVLAAYRRLAAGADDCRPGVQLDLVGDQVKVLWPPPRTVADRGKAIYVALRDKASPDLRDGQMVWVHHTGQAVTSVALAQIWRHEGSGAAGERVGELLACRHWEQLCPSCRLFGSVDANAREDGARAEQNAYRGHVRLHDAPAVGEVRLEEVLLPAQGAPRAGAGQFYLDDPQDAATERVPAREWGSPHDAGTRRRLRGRKYYWTNGPQQRPGPVGRSEQQQARDTAVTVAASGSRFSTRVTFENLSRAELGSLLAALEPSRWGAAWADRPRDAAPDRLRLRLGGGKPHGYGIVRSRVRTVVLVSPQARWAGDGAGQPLTETELQSLVGEFVADTPQAVQATWPAAYHLLSRDFIDSALVQYPPGDRGDDFAFWQHSIGLRRGTQEEPLVRLPRAEWSAGRQVLDTADARQRREPPPGRPAPRRPQRGAR